MLVVTGLTTHHITNRIRVAGGLLFSLWSQIAQRETFHISFVQSDNKGYGAERITPASTI